MLSTSTRKRTAGLVFGILFGFLLQRSGVARHDVIMTQLTLTDFTMLKVILSAVITGLLLVNFLHHRGWVALQPKPGGIGMTIPGALVFGIGFAIAGYCPGTLAAAAGQGSMDALISGIMGVILGSWLFVLLFPFLERTIVKTGYWGDITLPDVLPFSRGFLTITAAFILTVVLFLLERFRW